MWTPLTFPLPELRDVSRVSSSWLATLGMGLAIGVPAAVGADPLAPTETARTNPYGMNRALQRPPTWLGENVHYRKGVGLEYRRELKLADTPVQLGFQGPVVRKKKSVGLTVEMRF
jgi:hypothetical protein